MDAYDDLEDDLKTGSYNPLKAVKHNCKNEEDYENTIYQILVMMMAEARELLKSCLYFGTLKF